MAILSMSSTISQKWKGAWSDPRLRRTMVVLSAILPLTLLVFRTFLATIELRNGIELPDQLLRLLTPVDLTWITFGLIYGGLALAIVVLASHPRPFLRLVAAYVILTLIRMICMYAVPLVPPPNMIALADPFVELFASSGKTLTKDLFFSGHTATLFLLALGMPPSRWKAALYCVTAAVALCVLWQHVHYTIDVLVAPLASGSAYRLGTMAVPEKEIP